MTIENKSSFCVQYSFPKGKTLLTNIMYLTDIYKKFMHIIIAKIWNKKDQQEESGVTVFVVNSKY